MPATPHPLVLIGYGDIARRVAERHPDHAIYALARRRPTAPTGHRGAWTGLAFDLDQNTPADLPAAALWCYFAPPPATGIEDTRVARWLSAAARLPAPVQIVYASTTAVYGDVAGEWVDETRVPAPAHDRGRRRLDAERQIQHWGLARGIPVTVLRITGIYACDRLPLEKIRAGTPIVCPDQAPWSNRIHAEDLADLYTALIDRAEQGLPVTGVFNISDNHPRPMTELYTATAAHFGLPMPPCRSLAEVLASATPMAREFLSESKRIDARAIQRALNWQPRYPDLEHALADCPPV